jgi:hypothetical protein
MPTKKTNEALCGIVMPDMTHIKYPPGLGGQTERVPKILSFGLDRFGGGRSNLQHDSECLKIRNGVVVLAVPSEPFSPNSLFNREKTGNYSKIAPKFARFSAESPIIQCLLGNPPKTEQGITGN